MKEAKTQLMDVDAMQRCFEGKILTNRTNQVGLHCRPAGVDFDGVDIDYIDNLL
jgi:hypothetical protein